MRIKHNNWTYPNVFKSTNHLRVGIWTGVRETERERGRRGKNHRAYRVPLYRRQKANAIWTERQEKKTRRNNEIIVLLSKYGDEFYENRSPFFSSRFLLVFFLSHFYFFRSARSGHPITFITAPYSSNAPHSTHVATCLACRTKWETQKRKETEKCTVIETNCSECGLTYTHMDRRTGTIPCLA